LTSSWDESSSSVRMPYFAGESRDANPTWHMPSKRMESQTTSSTATT
jgi:hypothetical protein